MEMITTLAFCAALALSDQDLGNITAQGDVGPRIGLLAPITEILDMDVTVKGVIYGEGDTVTPQYIEEIQLLNIRPLGSTGSSFGDIFIRDIDLGGLSVTIRF